MNIDNLYNKLEWIVRYVGKGIYSNKIGYEKDDILQELRMALYKSIENYLKLKAKGQEPDCNIQVWCYKSCLNSKNTLIRKIKQVKNSQIIVDMENFEIGCSEKNNFQFYRKGKKLFLTYDYINILEIGTADSKHNMAFFLTLEGYSYEEIAEKMQEPVSTIRNWIYQKKQFIRQHFEKPEEEELIVGPKNSALEDLNFRIN